MEVDSDNMLEGGPFFIYSLTGHNIDGVLEEVFLINENRFHPNEFQSMVIHVTGKLTNDKKSEGFTVHEVAKYLEQKFEFRRFSFYNCYVMDQEGNMICETSVRG